MEVKATYIQGVYILTPDVFPDNRGLFFESYNRKKIHELLSDIPDFVQDNQSKSCYGVVRGLHFQRPPYAQAKLVRVISGRVLDVALDLRRGSTTFGKWTSVELTGENRLQFFIPEGFAHGFSVLSPEALLQYKCSNYYNKASEGGIIWNDSALAIDWQLPEKDIILSDKDKVHPTFKEWAENKVIM